MKHSVVTPSGKHLLLCSVAPCSALISNKDVSLAILPDKSEHAPAHQIKLVSDPSAQSGEKQSAVALNSEMQARFFLLACGNKQYSNTKQIIYK